MPICPPQDLVPMLTVGGKRSSKWPKSVEAPAKFPRTRRKGKTPPQAEYGFFRKCWHVAQVKSNADRALVRELASRRITAFIPLEHIILQSAGASHPGQRMLLPGYVFVHLPPQSEALQIVKDSRHCFAILKFHGQAQFVLELDLKRIFLAMCDSEYRLPLSADSDNSEPAWQPIKPGTDCIILRGKMAGEHATIIDSHNPRESDADDAGSVTLQVPINNLGGAYTFRLSMNDVRPVG